jgi:hypothetical protein
MLPNNVKSKIIFFAVIRNLRPSKLFVNYLVINIYLLILGAIALPALAQSGAKSASIKPLLKKPIYAANSVLANGNWIKIAVTQNGIYRIDFALLRNMGINTDQIDPRNIKLYGIGAGMLPQENSKARIDDLQEMAILVQGETDGKFNPGDFIAFYGESQINQWDFNPSTKIYNFKTNLYSDTTYYFLTVANNAGKRIAKRNGPSSADTTISTYTHLYVYNNEKVNLTKSGKIWLGEEFDKVTQQSFNVSIPNLVNGSPVRIRSSVTARSFFTSTFSVNINGSAILTQNCGIVQPGYEAPYTCGLVVNTANFIAPSANFTLNYTYNKPAAGSIGWLDFIEVQAKAELRNNNGNFIFKDGERIGAGKTARYQIASNRSLNVLDVTAPLQPIQIEGSFSNNNYTINCETDSLKTFAVYDGSNFLQINGWQTIANQNLHALAIPDGFIISHPSFLTEAKRLAEHHTKTQGLTIAVINTQDIYNEFSGGAQDLCAIRDFLRMFYNRAGSAANAPKYALLFGRASYDYKYRQNPNTNFVPTFESLESFSPTISYCSDDFLGLLEDNEGRWDIGLDNDETLDIGLGRLIVTNNQEATDLVNKIISYTSAEAFGNWRNKVVFSADDGDGGLHINQADALANNILNKYPEYNVEKIYLDAYQLESTAGGARYPEAQKAINNSIENGCLIFNYTGHGGEVGLTAERVMGIDDVNKWTNGLKEKGIKLPMFLTATCEFSRFDDPGRFSAGELVLLNPVGGSIALFTTVRLVYSGQNLALNNAFYRHVGFDSASQLNPPRLGDIIKETKNDYSDKNTRNFVLLGDPFVKLAYPNFEVKTTQINGTPIANFNDTLKALEKFDIKGEVRGKNGVKLSSFNGVIYPVVYDKFANYETLGNNAPDNYKIPFVMQNSVLYRGKASVTNGDFTFSFVVPKDIAYQFGKGKISYYSADNLTDANGFSNTILIGGTGANLAQDVKGPEIKLFLNDEKFVNGGLTSKNSKLIVKLFDENGINTTGNGIGRDLSFVLNENLSQSTIVNDFYQATLNSYQSGEVSYEIKDLPAGKHTLRFKAFDTYNNPSEASLEFEVKSDDKPAIANLLNYPNPFSTFTTFHFDHNQRGGQIQVLLQIFTITGKLVKTIRYDDIASGTHFDAFTWDGKDEYGDKLANGAYIYKVKLKTEGQPIAESIQKLFILN